MEVSSRGDREAAKGMEWSDYWKSRIIVKLVVMSCDRVCVTGFWVLSRVRWLLNGVA